MGFSNIIDKYFSEEYENQEHLWDKWGGINKFWLKSEELYKHYMAQSSIHIAWGVNIDQTMTKTNFTSAFVNPVKIKNIQSI